VSEQRNHTTERRVLVAGTILPSDLSIERDRLTPLGIRVVDGRSLPPQELAHELARATGLLTEGFLLLDREALRRMTQCKIISFFSIGVETIDLAAAAEQGIVVTNAPNYCTDEVADHTMLLLLAVWRKTPQAVEITGGEDWNLDSLRPIAGLRGRTLGLVGYGSIARAVAVRARAFGMKIVAYDPYVPAERAGADVVMLPLNELCTASDVVSIHLPLTPETAGLMGRHQFALLSEQAVLVNTSRGGVVDEDALVDALEKGRISGAGLDVLGQEPPGVSKSRRLLSCRNTICTPHMAYYSEDSLRNVRRQATEALAVTLHDGAPPHGAWVNRTAMRLGRDRDSETSPHETEKRAAK